MVAVYKVLLVCAAGMSSSLLEASTIEAAQRRGHQLEIHAIQTIDPLTYGMVDGEKLFEQIMQAVKK